MTHTASEPTADPTASVEGALTTASRSRRSGRSKNDSGATQRDSATPAKTRPQARNKVHPVLARLFELYPKMFGVRVLPLKLGVFEDLQALHPDTFKREELKVALGLHTRSTRYLEAMAVGEKRHDLNAVPVEDVAPEHVHHAILEVFRRRQACSPDDLRPELLQRLVVAIGASGLSHQAYAVRMRTADEVLNAVLDAACTEFAEKAAKREALRGAFQASGCSMVEFAEMYGMVVAEVSQALVQTDHLA